MNCRINVPVSRRIKVPKRGPVQMTPEQRRRRAAVIVKHDKAMNGKRPGPIR